LPPSSIPQSGGNSLFGGSSLNSSNLFGNAQANNQPKLSTTGLFTGGRSNIRQQEDTGGDGLFAQDNASARKRRK